MSSEQILGAGDTATAGAPATTAKQQLRALLEKRKRLSVPEIKPSGTARTTQVLSFGQQRLWFLNQYLGPNAVYNMPLALRLRGAVNEAALLRSLDELVRRHESLRTRFDTREGAPVQIIDPPGMELEVEVVSASEAQAIAYWERSYHFDLARERLCRIRLLRDSAGDYVLLVTMHHSVSDGWSLGIIFHELASLYGAYARGEASPLAPLPIQYADYAQWQREWLQGEALERQVSYWREHLAGLPPVLALPTDRPRPVEQTFRGRTERFALPAALSERLQALSRERGVTLYMTLLSAFAVLLGRHSGQHDIAVGTPVANRARRETEGLIGFFVNMLVMRHDLRGDPSFVDLLEATRTTALRAYAHQDVPFERLVEALHPERTLSHSPLFQVAFALQNAPASSVELPDLAIGPFEEGKEDGNTQEGTSRFDLTLSLQESPLGLVGSLEYKSDLFDRGTMLRLLDHYARLLESIVAAPQARLSRLAMLGDEEQRQVLESGAAACDFPEATVNAVFEALAAGEANGLVPADPLRTPGLLELNERANRLAHRLLALGVIRGDVVGLCIEDGVDRLVGLLGILKTGAACLSIEAQPAGRRDYLLEVGGARLVVTPSLLCDEALHRCAGTEPAVSVTPRDLACVRYDAEVMDGEPTGRMISHRGLVAECLARSGAPSHEWIGALLESVSCSPDRSAFIAEPRVRSVVHRILDRYGELLPHGAIGTLHEGGDVAGWGYFRRPRLTAERFVPDACGTVPGGRLLRTGATARWTGVGKLELAGARIASSRRPEEARIGLERKLPGHPDVREAAVVALEGSGEQRPRWVAYVVRRAPDALPPEEFIARLKKWVRAQPEIQVVPAEWLVPDALPRIATGAVDRSALPPPQQCALENAYVAPRTPLEESLAEVWREQLGAERVGVEDNYFALGGDSIRSISLVAEARQRGMRFSIKDLFAYPTVSSLAAAIERGEVRMAEETRPIEPFSLLTETERARFVQRPGLEDAYPLSLMQQGMVLEALRHADLGIYLNFQIYEFQDTWDAALFDRALRHLLARHPMLRTIHDLSAERPLQLVLREPVLNLKIIDARQLEAGAIQQALQNWAQGEQAIGLDTTVSLWRATVHLLPGEKFLLGLHLHHAMWDGWSLESFVTELYSTYGLLKREGRVVEQRPLPSYQQFVALEQSALASEPHRSYWAGKLENATVPWWTGQAKSPGACIACEVSPDTSERLAALARRLGVQEKSVWCSVYLALLSLLNGTAEGLGTVMTQGRPEIPDGDRMVGLFLNALPIRGMVAGRRWVELVVATDRELREQHAYRQYPLAEMQRVTGLDFSASMFNYSNWHVYQEGVDRGGTRDEWIPQKVGGWQETNYLLSFSVHRDDQGGRHQVSIVADSGVFDASFLERMHGYVANILAEITRDASAVIEKGKLLGGAERRLRAGWNATTREYPEHQCIHELFEWQVHEQPDAIAVLLGECQLSFGELNRRANRVARCLRRHGAGPEVRVGICLERSLEMIIAVLGVLKAGSAYVPLDPAYPRQRLRHLVSDAAPACLLVDAAGRQALGDLPPSMRLIDLRSDESQWEKFPGDDVDVAELGLRSSHAAYVIYTSGSTGNPKGVVVAHSQVINLWQALECTAYASGPVRSVSLNASFSFDASVQQWAQLLSGRTLAIVPDAVRLDPAELWGYLARHGVEGFDCTPSALEGVVASQVVTPAGYVPKVVLVGGEAFNEKLWAASSEWAAASFFNVYGPTECTVDATFAAVTRETRPSIGQPLSNTQAHVLDRDLQPLPIGVAGELCIGGAGLSRGYLNRPALTAEKFVPNAFAKTPGERLYRTGDLARWLADGKLEFLGRIDHQVKVRGYRIELGEIEAALLAHQAVRDAVVIALDDESGGKRLVGYVVPRSDAQVDETTLPAALRGRLQEQLPGYMVPSALVLLAGLPLTANGKLDRKALPAPGGNERQRPYEAPEGDIEVALANRWQELLRVPRVGRHDNFFELGGHSLLALRVCNVVRADFGVEIKVPRMFGNPSVAQLAVQIAIELDARNPGANRAARELPVDVEEGSF